MKKIMKQKGFTLAETLITLVIVGIIAAITVPTLITKYQKEQTVTRLKKAYSSIMQTTNKAIADNGPMKSWTIENGKTKEFVDTYMAPYLSVSKNCGYETTGDCKFEHAPLNNKNNKTLFGSDFYKIILNDGTTLILKARSSTAYSSVIKKSIPILIANVYIDINGQKGPNVYGRDIFYLIYWINCDYSPYGGEDYSGVLEPNGGWGFDSAYYKNLGCNKNGDGGTCIGVIMTDGWQITKDYPWQ